jgi:hypothetical protein
VEAAPVEEPLKGLPFWAPRILGLPFAVFIGILAVDVFGAQLGFWSTLLALLIHLIPTWIVLIVLALAWRRGWIGGVVFPALGALYLVMLWGKFHWSAYLVIPGSLVLLGILFLTEWLSRRTYTDPAQRDTGQ